MQEDEPSPPRSAPAGSVAAPDAAARALATNLLSGMRHAALACLSPLRDEAGESWPHLSRIAVQAGPDGVPVALLSGLALHSRALAADPRAALLIAPEEAEKGDPMIRPRLSLQVRAEPGRPVDPAERAAWLAADPKATLYIDLPDFRLVRLVPLAGLLNAGFGRASAFGPGDLPPARWPA